MSYEVYTGDDLDPMSWAKRQPAQGVYPDSGWDKPQFGQFGHAHRVEMVGGSGTYEPGIPGGPGGIGGGDDDNFWG